MDGVNMNKLARDMRPEMLGTKEQKIRFWIDDVDIKVKRRLSERIKFVPTSEIRFSPTRAGSPDLRPSGTKDDYTTYAGPSSLRTLNEEEIMTIEEHDILPRSIQ